MRIVFYSTNSNNFDSENMIFTTIPCFETQFKQFCSLHPEHEFFIVTQKPGLFLPQTKNTIYVNSQETKDIGKAVLDFTPDLAVAFSFWTAPFDWLSVKDSLVADFLRSNGVKTLCHNTTTAMTCFDKWETHNFLEKNGLNFAKGVFVKHDLYFCAGNQKDVLSNVYKEAVLEQIKALNFPVIIKENVGLSSYGICTANTFGEVTNYLNSKKNNSDRIVEEYIDGEQFGTEIWGNSENYTVFPPLKFSLNKYGITTPKLSRKTGPFYENFTELKELLLQVAQKLKLSGPAQVDLVLHKGQWYIIEINPRLSGMTLTYCASCGQNIYEMMWNLVITGETKSLDFEQVENYKTQLSDKTELEELKDSKDVKYIFQTENKAAKQEREKGYCEIIKLKTDSI